MIRAVIFDCFGVLTSEGWVPFRDQYFGNDPEKFQQAKALMHQLATRQVTDDEFEAAIASLAGVSRKEVRRRMSDNAPTEAVFAYIRDIKPHYKTAMLSNVGKNRLHEIFTDDQLALIDVFALSSETGYAKPDPMAYRTVAARLGVACEECVFVDDQPLYIEGAVAVGMRTVLFGEVEQGVANLRSVLANA